MRVTINDVAKETGLSKTAVSLILNNREHRMSDGKVKLVKEKASEMGYRPNQIARSLTHNKTNTIGLIIPDIRNAFFSDMAKGVEDEAYSMGYSVFFCNSDNIYQKEIHYLKALYDRGVDGIILDFAVPLKKDGGQDSMTFLKNSNLPVVLLDRSLKNSGFSSVTFDNHKGAYQAVKYLIECGHKQIGCIAGALELDCDHDRIQGYKQAMGEFGLSIDPEWIVEGGYQMEGGRFAASYLTGKGVSAIFSFNDIMAYGALDVLREMNWKVPEDISVMGFDNIRFSDLSGNALSTVGQPSYEMGRKAVHILVEEMKFPKKEKQHFIFDPTLHIRKTVKYIKLI